MTIKSSLEPYRWPIFSCRSSLTCFLPTFADVVLFKRFEICPSRQAWTRPRLERRLGIVTTLGRSPLMFSSKRMSLSSLRRRSSSGSEKKLKKRSSKSSLEGEAAAAEPQPGPGDETREAITTQAKRLVKSHFTMKGDMASPEADPHPAMDIFRYCLCSLMYSEFLAGNSRALPAS